MSSLLLQSVTLQTTAFGGLGNVRISLSPAAPFAGHDNPERHAGRLLRAGRS